MAPLRSVLLAASAAFFLLILAPASQAAEYGFGSSVAASDYDFSPIAETTKTALCFIDFNGDALHGNGEPVLLLLKVTTAGACPATLANNALLLSAHGGRTVGMEVNQMDEWSSKALTAFPANFLRYFEDGSDASKLDGKDGVYLDIKNTAAPRVDVGDLRLTKAGALPAGSLVAAGDPDLNYPLTEIRGAPRTVSTTNMIYKAGSAYYINADAGAIGGISCTGPQGVPCTPTCTPAVTAPPAATGTCTIAGLLTVDVGVESGDIRLNPKAVNPLGDKALVLVDGLKLSASTLRPDEPFQLEVIAKNTGKGAGVGLVKTWVDGTLVDARATAMLSPNEVGSLVLSLKAPSEPGRYKVTAGDYSRFINVEGDPISTGTSIAPLEARIAALEAQLADPGAANPSAVSSIKGAPGPMPAMVLGLAILGAIILRRRAA